MAADFFSQVLTYRVVPWPYPPDSGGVVAVSIARGGVVITKGACLVVGSIGGRVVSL